jgi:hypothetical protein
MRARLAENAEQAMISKACAPGFTECEFLIKVLCIVCRARSPKISRENCKKCKIGLAGAVMRPISDASQKRCPSHASAKRR